MTLKKIGSEISVSLVYVDGEGNKNKQENAYTDVASALKHLDERTEAVPGMEKDLVFDYTATTANRATSLERQMGNLDIKYKADGTIAEHSGLDRDLEKAQLDRKGENAQLDLVNAVNDAYTINKAAIEQDRAAIANNTAAISDVNGRVSRLDSKVNKVGAGAAALAALHPLDYDADNKLSFSAGFGNYHGANATALGVFYRPNERVMFSLAGNMGNGENMVNLGVSFALDRVVKAGVSKNAMAAKIEDQKQEFSDLKQDVEELKAMVAALSAKVK